MNVFKTTLDGVTKAVVTVEADNFEKVANTEAKNLAISEATKHLGVCGISNTSGPYPVDEHGEELVDANKLTDYIRAKKKVKYHNDYTLTKSFGS